MRKNKITIIILVMLILTMSIGQVYGEAIEEKLILSRHGPLYLLLVVWSIWQHSGNVEHNFIVLVRCVQRVSTR